MNLFCVNLTVVNNTKLVTILMLFFKLRALTGMAEMRNSFKISYRKSDVKDHRKT
jgi:hypothetical protein